MATSTWRQIGLVMEWVEDAVLAHDEPWRFCLLDAGCGWGRYGALIRYSWPGTLIWGLDPRSDRCECMHAYDVLVSGALPRPSARALERSFDLILLLDVVEHLEKAAGLETLAWCRSRGPTIVATPSGFVEQEGETPHDRHRSGWTVGDLEALGPSRLDVVYPRESANGARQLVARYEAAR